MRTLHYIENAFQWFTIANFAAVPYLNNRIEQDLVLYFNNRTEIGGLIIKTKS